MDKDKFSKFYVFIFFSGDGTIQEALQGFHIREDLNEFMFRLASFPGGGATAAAGNQCYHHGLDRVSKAANCLYVTTRLNFTQISITKYDTDGPVPIIYGFHS